MIYTFEGIDPTTIINLDDRIESDALLTIQKQLPDNTISKLSIQLDNESLFDILGCMLKAQSIRKIKTHLI